MMTPTQILRCLTFLFLLASALALMWLTTGCAIQRGSDGYQKTTVFGVKVETPGAEQYKMALYFGLIRNESLTVRTNSAHNWHATTSYTNGAYFSGSAVSTTISATKPAK